MLPKFLKPPLTLRDDRPLVLAHRGASADAPENTLAAFHAAVLQGADGVELDVMVCGSGELVVVHDEWLDRLAGEHLEVARTPLARLRELDMGRHLGAHFAGHRIPTLDEVLANLPRGFIVNVELKSERALDRLLAFRTLRAIARDRGEHRFVLSSFNPLTLAKARLVAPRTPLAMLFEPKQSPRLRELAGMALWASAIAPHHTRCTLSAVERWHAQGFAVAAWTVDDPTDVERCCRAGVDVLITNKPAATLTLATSFGKARAG